MKNIELQQILMKFPPNIEVGVFKVGMKTIHDIYTVYIGNEGYIPGGDKTKPDKLVISYR